MPDKRTIVITGVSRGLGRAMALEFAARGHVIAGCGRTAAALVDLRRQVGASGHFNVVDVASDRQVDHWAQKVIDTLGPPDLLLNNAALINRNAPLWQVPAGEFSTLVDVNIKGVANVTTRRLDVLDDAAVEQLVGELPPLSILFNCAGYVHNGTILECAPKDWEFTMNLNVRSMYAVTRAALPRMIAEHQSKGTWSSMTSWRACRSSAPSLP